MNTSVASGWRSASASTGPRRSRKTASAMARGSWWDWLITPSVTRRWWGHRQGRARRAPPLTLSAPPAPPRSSGTGRRRGRPSALPRRPATVERRRPFGKVARRRRHHVEHDRAAPLSPIAPHGRDHGPAAEDEEAGDEAEHEAHRLEARVDEDLRVRPPVRVHVDDAASRGHHRQALLVGRLARVSV